MATPFCVSVAVRGGRTVKVVAATSLAVPAAALLGVEPFPASSNSTVKG
jgi:hypothetical protein